MFSSCDVIHIIFYVTIYHILLIITYYDIYCFMLQRPDVARTLLATVARHVNPILRDRGWRVKRLIESASSSWIGLCTANGRQGEYLET